MVEVTRANSRIASHPTPLEITLYLDNLSGISNYRTYGKNTLHKGYNARLKPGITLLDALGDIPKGL
jgi:hypothetical protein